jgi:hypothetical protein
VGEKLKKLVIAQQPQNTLGNKLDSVISHVIVYIVLGCCEVPTEIGAVKAAEGDRQYSYIGMNLSTG